LGISAGQFVEIACDKPGAVTFEISGVSFEGGADDKAASPGIG
jgi:hypothetical protein